MTLDSRLAQAWISMAAAEEKLGRVGNAVRSYERLLAIASAHNAVQIAFARQRLCEFNKGQGM